MKPRGLTLVECLVGVCMAGVLLGATCAVLLAGQRAALALASALDARHNADAAGAVLRGELRTMADGELIRISDSAIALRALRGAGTACAVDPVRLSVTLDDATWSSLRAVDPLRDSIRLLAGERWIQLGIASVGAGTCPSGAGTTLAVSGAAPSDLAAADSGTPARLVEVVEYRRYADGAGAHWFGVRTPAGASWSASSPIAGPLDPAGGLVITADSSRLIEASVRVRGRRVQRSWGIAVVRDSAAVAAAAGSP